MIGVEMYITIKSLWERHKNKSMIAKWAAVLTLFLR